MDYAHKICIERNGRIYSAQYIVHGYGSAATVTVDTLGAESIAQVGVLDAETIAKLLLCEMADNGRLDH